MLDLIHSSPGPASPPPKAGSIPAAPNRVFPHFQALDGMRAVAVLMVILIHSRLLPFGWVGVQMFFVLSGFLITGILLTQTGRPFGVFVRGFYWRRGLRIWPLYFFFLALCATAYEICGVPETWHQAWGWLVTFTYNFARISPSFPDSDYYGHFWTLCVEEQFYLVWPFVLFFLPLTYFRRLVVLLVVCGPLFRYATGLYFQSQLDSLPYIYRGVHSLATSHLDAFAWGALLAVAPAEWRKSVAPRATTIFVAALTLTVAAGLCQSCMLWAHGLPPHWRALGYDTLDYFHQYVWAYTLLNFSSAAMILCAINQTALARVLSVAPLVYVGKISYGVYLWHLPLLCLASIVRPADQHSIAGLLRFAVCCVILLAVSSVSYYGYERHFLRMKDKR